eukprot:GEMP01076894.1.p1 GENE.GEMP01076894.1~~GEMP01076894.1.p1  ORF type:complete len:129 (+),score=27.00 GEMP01076894.1:501-887(+)
MTPLHYAAQFGCPRTVDFLLAAGAHVDPRDGPSEDNAALKMTVRRTPLGRTVLMYTERHAEVCRILVRACAEVTDEQRRHASCYSPITDILHEGTETPYMRLFSAILEGIQTPYIRLFVWQDELALRT